MIVLSIIGIIFLAGNILVVANWLEKGLDDKAKWICEEFLMRTVTLVIAA